MSKSRMVKITCPKCNKESKFRIWESINTQLDPDLKSAVRDQSAFLFECPYCGKRHSIYYGFLYHQMEDNMMIHCVTSDKEFQEVMDLYNGENSKIMNDLLNDGYLIRVVQSREALLEKLSIFDAGLDDRIIELMKLLYLDQFREEAGDKNLDSIYFVNSENKKTIEFVYGGHIVAQCDFNEKIYSKIKNTVIDRLPPINKDYVIIDYQWAIDYTNGQ